MSTADGTRPLDARGRRRSPATLPGHNAGRAPSTKGRTFRADPIQVTDVVALLDAAKPKRAGRPAELASLRLRALIVLLWRSGLRISEALALEEHDLDPQQQTVHVRRGKGDRPRTIVMDEWGWQGIAPWLHARRELPVGVVFCVLSGKTAGRPMSATDARRQLREAAATAGLRRRANPHSFRHALATELWTEGVQELVISRQLGHQRLDTTSIYLRGIAPRKVLDPVATRRPPLMPVPNVDARR